MPDPTFDDEFVRFLLKYSDEAYLGSGFHMDASGWIAWVRHVGEMGGKPISNLEALRRLEHILDDRTRNPFRPGVRERWENRVIDLRHDRQHGPAFDRKVDEAIARLKELFADNGVKLTPPEWQAIHSQFRIRLLQMVALQMALGGGEYHIRDAAARAFRKMWTANEWGLHEKLPVPVQAWAPVYQLDEQGEPGA
jgi:hypothetical protein